MSASWSPSVPIPGVPRGEVWKLLSSGVVADGAGRFFTLLVLECALLATEMSKHGILSAENSRNDRLTTVFFQRDG